MKKDIFYIIIILLLLGFTYWQHQDNSFTQKIANQNLNTSLDSLQFYKNKLGQEVSEKSSFVSKNKKLKDIISKKDKELQLAIEKFKSISSVAKIESVTKIDSLKISFTKPLDFPFSIPFEKHTTKYSINGLSTNFGVDIYKFEVYNHQLIVFGRKRTGMFKSEYRLEVTNSNPLIKVTGQESYQFVNKEKRFGLGPHVGYDLITGNSTIGISLNYDLFRF